MTHLLGGQSQQNTSNRWGHFWQINLVHMGRIGFIYCLSDQSYNLVMLLREITKKSLLTSQTDRLTRELALSSQLAVNNQSRQSNLVRSREALPVSLELFSLKAWKKNLVGPLPDRITWVRLGWIFWESNKQLETKKHFKGRWLFRQQRENVVEQSLPTSHFHPLRRSSNSRTCKDQFLAIGQVSQSVIWSGRPNLKISY